MRNSGQWAVRAVGSPQSAVNQQSSSIKAEVGGLRAEVRRTGSTQQWTGKKDDIFYSGKDFFQRCHLKCGAKTTSKDVILSAMDIFSVKSIKIYGNWY